MRHVLILNGFLLICFWVTGFVALQTGQLGISIAIAFIFLLQLWGIFELIQMSRRERSRS